MNLKQIIIRSIIASLVILAAIFSVLKLCGVVAWSWLWVLSPLWIPITIMCVLTLILPALFFICAILDD